MPEPCAACEWRNYQPLVEWLLVAFGTADRAKERCSALKAVALADDG
jgi:hypothetical protein